jgi:hypothetical protein
MQNIGPREEEWDLRPSPTLLHKPAAEDFRMSAQPWVLPGKIQADASNRVTQKFELSIDH